MQTFTSSHAHHVLGFANRQYIPVEVFKECDAGRRKSAGLDENARPASHASKRTLRADLRRVPGQEPGHTGRYHAAY
ncbi:hypothetical protein [Corynebacterium sp. CCUG 51687]|uniref:hypothetical protein n=1 Tax=Corynebacterium sp. CCUG 51687 TaxID=2823897 RepID=UPI00210D3BFD|nr:hypothetical protein [Corynebacterium sp. CCUG 51687]MCQ4612416.1 hypothetical protein [Corynebacterium sp. CCUG 51687]